MYRILNVDDEIGSLTLFKVMLQRSGFEPFITPHSEETFKIVEECNPHLILLDTTMPGIHGHDLCRQLKASPDTKPIPVVFFSAQNLPHDIVKGMEAGAFDYLGKPLIYPQLVNAIREILQKIPDLEPFFALKRRWRDCRESDRSATFLPMIDDAGLDSICREFLEVKLAQ